MREKDDRRVPRAAWLLATLAAAGAMGIASIASAGDRDREQAGTMAASIESTPSTDTGGASVSPALITTPMVVVGVNDLGMHCMQQDFSEMMILPPFNTLRAQVIRRGLEPSIRTSGITVSYYLPTNTHGADKTNFWRYAQQLLGAAVPPDTGVTGTRMSGTMSLTGNGDWHAVGIPVIPVDDNGRDNPYPLATITVKNTSGVIQAQTQAVVPVSWEMACNICHNTPGISTATDILRAHDRLHGTTLEAQKPVLCAACHSDNALGLPGQPGIKSMSAAMHGAHAPRMATAGLTNECYACHPGIRTDCLRDVHAARGMNCKDCHQGMAEVGNPARNPWVDLPRCDNCHHVAGHAYEQPGKLFKESYGHKGVQCVTCHSSPHSITPATTALDNLQSIRLQGAAGPLASVSGSCSVCHISQPSDPFFHKFDN